MFIRYLYIFEEVYNYFVIYNGIDDYSIMVIKSWSNVTLVRWRGVSDKSSSVSPAVYDL